MILYDRQLVILHPPKTGGIALQKALGYPTGPEGNYQYAVWRHDTLEDVFKAVPESRGWAIYLLVRNPYSRMVSYYHFMVQTDFRTMTPAQRYVRSFDTCERFLLEAKFHGLREHANRKRSGTIEACSYYGKVGGAYLKGIIPISCERLSEVGPILFDVEVPVYNASDHHPWQSYYTQKSAARVANFMREDFERFDWYTEDSWLSITTTVSASSGQKAKPAGSKRSRTASGGSRRRTGT